MDDVQDIVSKFSSYKESDLDKKIPVPTLDYIRKQTKNEQLANRNGQKYDREYDAFCRWISLPQNEREPKTETAFEKKWRLPRRTSLAFRRYRDFRNRRLLYFWEWMFDMLPEVASAIAKRAMAKGGSADARIFAEMISKHMDVQKPQNQITNIVIQGVSQDKLDNLFIPDDMQDVEDITPQEV